MKKYKLIYRSYPRWPLANMGRVESKTEKKIKYKRTTLVVSIILGLSFIISGCREDNQSVLRDRVAVE